MQYGICCGPDTATIAKRVGFDYFEWTVEGILKPTEGADAFAGALAEAKEAPLPCPVVNCFVPGDLKITGPTVDADALREYVNVCCSRAREAGIEVIVFGSGGARQIPDGFDRAEAQQQVRSFCEMLAPIASDYGITIAVEPLSRSICNILTGVGECAELVRKVDHPALRLLADSYHLLLDDDSLGDVTENGSLLRHVHIATVPSRLAPGAEACDLLPFFKALVAGGYDGRISLECILPESEDELAGALLEMTRMVQTARAAADA